MQYVVMPARDDTSRWTWRLVTRDGEVRAEADSKFRTPRSAREDAVKFRSLAHVAPVVLAT